ncbi:MAG: NFYB/HAP3 family transcription factor subunit [Candidatus Aenigmarchaeota archaeon]|nr:NFYB/HAP3 family transcription factor subunit [Candidatus Aenigmarchaeota archaeon]
MEYILTLAPLRKLMKKAGAKRVSDSATAEMAKVLEEKASKIASEAHKLAQHSGRRTVIREDIKLAVKRVG